MHATTFLVVGARFDRVSEISFHSYGRRVAIYGAYLNLSEPCGSDFRAFSLRALLYLPKSLSSSF